ncbi:guanine deaminase [Aspergillus bertholletiae]|uniref:Probable guanine deaminase n=1 Tax=Aspergillus bertholletiae TaxID=1226010 RepID=A0A5N7ARE5_9EURO|nr:guanine deaminase [Aspergillus bertholletiae]
MFPNFFRLPVGLHALWLCLILLDTCSSIVVAYPYTVYRGTFVYLPRLNSSSAKPKLVRHQGVLWVSSDDGRIKGYDWQVHDEASFQSFLSRQGWTDAYTTTNSDADSPTKVNVVMSNDKQNEFFFPGFIDTHIHAPQFPNVGLFGSAGLLDWLNEYTFPVEASFGSKSDPNNQNTDPKDTPPEGLRVYDQVVARTLAHGTTCASYFATIHVPATNALAALCHSHGQRAFIGRVCMDNRDQCPPYYVDQSAEEGFHATKSTIDYIRTLDPRGTLINPIITPRFAPSCSNNSLDGLGKLAASYNPPLHIQTHISESIDEVNLVHQLFPESTSYADVYDKADLLTSRTILAHGVHLTQDERTLIRERGAKVAHCPASNSALGSGLAPVRIMLDEGLTVGLGTDVSGGYSPSILEAARQACLVSRLLGFSREFQDMTDNSPPTGHEKLSVDDSLYLATRGGAAVVDMADDIGGFDKGMIWDAQLIELGAVRNTTVGPLDAPVDGPAGRSLFQSGPVGNVDLFGNETWQEQIQKWMWSGDDRNVKNVWVQGKLVHTRK